VGYPIGGSAPCRGCWRRAKRLTSGHQLSDLEAVDLPREAQDRQDSWRTPPRSGERNRPPISQKLERGDIETRRGNFRKISGRNQLFGRVLDVKYSGLLAQVTLKIGEQQITAIITADAAKEMRLKAGERAAALIKSTEVMILAYERGPGRTAQR